MVFSKIVLSISMILSSWAVEGPQAPVPFGGHRVIELENIVYEIHAPIRHLERVYAAHQPLAQAISDYLSRTGNEFKPEKSLIKPTVRAYVEMSYSRESGELLTDWLSLEFHFESGAVLSLRPSLNVPLADHAEVFGAIFSSEYFFTSKPARQRRVRLLNAAIKNALKIVESATGDNAEFVRSNLRAALNGDVGHLSEQFGAYFLSSSDQLVPQFLRVLRTEKILRSVSHQFMSLPNGYDLVSTVEEIQKQALLTSRAHGPDEKTSFFDGSIKKALFFESQHYKEIYDKLPNSLSKAKKNIRNLVTELVNLSRQASSQMGAAPYRADSLAQLAIQEKLATLSLQIFKVSDKANSQNRRSLYSISSVIVGAAGSFVGLGAEHFVLGAIFGTLLFAEAVNMLRSYAFKKTLAQTLKNTVHNPESIVVNEVFTTLESLNIQVPKSFAGRLVFLERFLALSVSKRLEAVGGQRRICQMLLE